MSHFIWLLLSAFWLPFTQGVPQTNVASLVGETCDLPCDVDSAKCGELHSIKWYRGSSRIFVFSESANIAKAEGDYADRAELRYDRNATKSTLRVNPIKVTDEALYKCEITYIEVREGCSVVQFINLTTQIKPVYVKMSRDSGIELTNSSLLGPLNEGHRLTLICESGGGKPVPLVEWWNGTNKITGIYKMDADTNGVGTGRNTVHLLIGRGDLGAKYECRADNDALDVPYVSSVELDVNVRPSKMDLSGVEHHVVQGTNVHLQCNVQGARPAANVTWFNGSEPIREDLVITTAAVKADGTYETQSSLLFTASRYENGGTLTCEAINSVMIDRDEPPIKSTLLLEVMYPPIVRVSPTNITVNESTDILLICSYEANPTSLKSVKWLRNDIEMELDPEHYDDGTIEQPTLRIKNATRLDQGVYICILENNVGSAQSENDIYVNITYKPEVRVMMDPPSPAREIDLGNVTLCCQVTSGNPDVLRAVRWYLNSSLLKELPDCSQDEGLCDVNPTCILLQEVRRGFHGNYSCEGMNDAGWGPLSENVELVVYYPPGPAVLDYEPKKVVKKGSVKLTCTVGDPGRPPSNTYRWVRGSHLIQDVTSSNWTIDPVTLETKANFTCSAYNLGGDGESSSVFIDVHAPPSFIERLPPYHGALMSAQNVSLSCRVECSPICTISWQKQGKLLNTVNSPLYSIKQTVIPPDPRTNDFESVHSTLVWNMSGWPGGQLDRLHDSANYSCLSSPNHVGNGVRSFTFFGVEYPPENITVSSKAVHVIEGHAPEKVICSSKAYPEASYHWRKEGENEVIMKGKTLILNYPMPRRGGGNYVCEAFNRHGSVTGVTYIDVLFKPECGITATESGGRQVLICTAHANPGRVDFMWRIKNENETVEDPVENRGLESYLTLESRIDNFRTYLCYANNSVGMSVPCERDVTGKPVWWPPFENDNLLIIVAVVIGAILVFLIVCVIIIVVCRRKRADDKYNKPMELEERENYESYERFILNLYGPDVQHIPEGNSASPPAIQTALTSTPTMTSPTPKWPLKPGVLVHMKSARLQNGNSMSSLQTSTPVQASAPVRGRSNRRVWVLQRRRALSLNSLAQADDTSQRSRARRIRKMFSSCDTRGDTLPNGVTHGASGVVTFRRVDGSRSAQSTGSRKRKKPGDGPSQSGTGDKSGLGPQGSPHDGLDERAFYENLPFHGMQNPPAKCDDANGENRPPSKLSSGYGSGRSTVMKPVRRSNTTLAHNNERMEPKFHSLRVYRRATIVEPGGRIKSTSTIMVPKSTWTCPEHTQDVEKNVPSVPDRKMKPKFFHIGKSKKRENEDNDWCGLEDNMSLLSGIQRLSWSPAPTPAPRKAQPTTATRCVQTKHTYQNVPIPISPNNSQNDSTENKKALESQNYRLTSSQTHLLPSHTTYDLMQSQGRPRNNNSNRRNKHHDTHSLRSRKQHPQHQQQQQQQINGTLRPNHVFFNSLRDADRQHSDSEVRTRRTTKDRLKESAPLQVMRFKDLLTAAGGVENYNRQSNSDSSNERKTATDSSSGDLETGLFKNISSGEETLLRRNGTISSVTTANGDHELYRPVPVLPIQSLYTSRGNEPLLLPHYAPLGGDNDKQPSTTTVYSPESAGTPGNDSDLTPSDPEPWARENGVFADLAAMTRNARNNRSHAFIQDIGHEIDV